MTELKREFSDRNALIAYVQQLCPWAQGEASAQLGGARVAAGLLAEIQPLRYAKTRNFGDGAVTHLSPFVRHGVLTLVDLKQRALECCVEAVQVSGFLQQLAWRDFWQRLYYAHPDWIWQDIEPYKTGFSANEYTDALPSDIRRGCTGVACIDAFCQQLFQTGYLHNHARLYVAAYVVHFRRVKWQAGAAWFLHHLLDGDPASNNFSWQWVASTFSQRPYIFNLENVQHYFADQVDTTAEANAVLNASYAELQQRLFPRLDSGAT